MSQEVIDRTKYDFMFWHASHRPEPIEGVIVKAGGGQCSCGAVCTDYYIPKTLMKKWKEHCEKTGFGW